MKTLDTCRPGAYTETQAQNQAGNTPHQPSYQEMEQAIRVLLQGIGEDLNREGLLKTPERVVKALMYLTHGYQKNPLQIAQSAVFHEPSAYGNMVLVKNIDIHSICEHHMLPIIGKISIAYIPKDKIIGLSKIPRVAEAWARRLQVQERLCSQIATTLEEAIDPLGVAVHMQAEHMCMSMRGVEKAQSITVTHVFRGVFQTDKDRQREFLMAVQNG